MALLLEDGSQECGGAKAALPAAAPSHIITAKQATPYMIRNRRGFIGEVMENDVLSSGGNPVIQAVKLALRGLAFNMPTDYVAWRCWSDSASQRKPGAKVGRKTGTSWNQSRRC